MIKRTALLFSLSMHLLTGSSIDKMPHASSLQETLTGKLRDLFPESTLENFENFDPVLAAKIRDLLENPQKLTIELIADINRESFESLKRIHELTRKAARDRALAEETREAIVGIRKGQASAKTKNRLRRTKDERGQKEREASRADLVALTDAIAAPDVAPTTILRDTWLDLSETPLLNKYFNAFLDDATPERIDDLLTEAISTLEGRSSKHHKALAVAIINHVIVSAEDLPSSKKPHSRTKILTLINSLSAKKRTLDEHGRHFEDNALFNKCSNHSCSALGKSGEFCSDRCEASAH